MSAAANLFRKALPTQSTSTSTPTNGLPIRGRASIAARGNGRSPGNVAGATNEDVGMTEAAGGVQRKGKHTNRAAGPMGQRPRGGKPSRGTTRGGKSNGGPAVIRDSRTGDASSSSKSKSTSKSNHIDNLRLFLQMRYSSELRMLNLEFLADDPTLKKYGIHPPGHKDSAANLAAVWWKLAAEMFPEVVSLSLANNNLTSLLVFSPWLLTTSLQNIENLSLANNKLGKFSDLDALSPFVGKTRQDGKAKGFRNLKELVLIGNPIVRLDDYKRQMARRFSNLSSLDQEPFDTSIAFTDGPGLSTSNLTPGLSPGLSRSNAKSRAAREPIVFPLPIATGFFDLEADTTPSYRVRAKKIGAKGDKTYPNQHKLDWKDYIGVAGSRNLSRVRYPEKRLSTLKMTPQDVITQLAALPKTRHPLDDPSKFVFDCYTLPGFLPSTTPGGEAETVIMACVHGQFAELPCEGIRSFDRTFILAPAPAGSPAHNAGWPCVIVSEIFTIRAFSDPVAWAPQTPSNAAASSTSAVPPAPNATQERAPGITDEQHLLVLQLQNVTKLTYSFAYMCLEQNGWVPETALANFQQLQAGGAIPPEAFVA